MRNALASSVVLMLLDAAVGFADTLGLSPPSVDAEVGVSMLAMLPAFVPYLLGAGAVLLFLTLAWPRPARAERHADVTTVRVRPPSGRGETGKVLRAAAAVALAAFALTVARAQAARSPTSLPAPRAGALAPFQVAYRDIAPSLQRTYRALQAGIVAAEQRRATSGRWPDVDTLIAAGIAPFAPSPGLANAYAWTLRSDDAGINYVGIPVGDADAPALLIAIADPAPGGDTPGETHRLSGDTAVVVSTWFRPAGVALASPTGIVTKPQNERWMQIVARDR